MFSRKEILEKLYEKINNREPIIGSGAGIGLSAKASEAGGADFIIIYNSGRYRMAGFGSLAGLMPYGDAHEVLLAISKEVLSVVKKTPVLAGICGTHPLYQGEQMRKFIRRLKDEGFSGVQNFPTVGLIDKNSIFRINLEETGMGFDKEVQAIRIAHEEDMVTAPYVFDVEDTIAMVKNGADIIVAHMGLTAKGMIGAKTTLSLEDAAKKCQEIADAAKSVKSDIIVLVHGGPIADFEDFKYIVEHTRGIHGFFGASTFERIPTEEAISEVVRSFKSIKLRL
ncbi:MAG: phosphoenolpyruvate hydrolase family protein [Candidatus Bathyarchaeia archaeon]